MKVKTTFLASIGIITLTLLSIFHFQMGDNKTPKHYNPYKPEKSSFTKYGNEEESKKKGYEGAARYLNLLRANPYTGDVAIADVKKAIDQANSIPKRKKPAKIQWVSKGPDNFGGRTRAIVVDNRNKRTLYAAGVSGGLFRSTNKGSSWHPVKYEGVNQYKSLAIVCMEQASDGTIYFGTGEQGFAPSYYKEGFSGKTGHIGMGMWKSENGTNWTHLESTIPNSPMSGTSGWDNVHEIAIDPSNPERILAGTDGGLQISNNGGKDWQTIIDGLPSNTAILEVNFSPDGQTVFASTGTRLYRSTDKGNSFSMLDQQNNNFPTGNNIRIETAISPQDPNFVYASVARTNEQLKGIYQSQDNGKTWTKIGTGGTGFNPLQGQGSYDNVIAVDPYQKNRIFVGGVEFWIWDGGENYNSTGQWIKASNPSPYYGSNNQFKDNRYLHVDHHEIAFDTRSNPPVMYIGNDGGISRTMGDFRKGKTPEYKQINIGYTTTQFYAFDVAQRGDVAGGTQDMGNLVLSQSSLSEKSYKEAPIGGDGFYTEISKLNPNIYMMESQGANLNRSLDGGSSFNSNLYDEHITPVDPKAMFNTPFKLYENANDTLSQDSVVFTANNEIVLEEGESKKVSNNNLIQLYQNDTNFIARPNDSFEAKRDISFLPGTTIDIKSQNGVDFQYELKRSLTPGENLKIVDPVRGLFVIALRDEIWLTPDMLNFGSQPTWFKIADINLNTPLTLDFTPDGKHLFVGGWTGIQGRVYRISGIRKAHYQYKSESEHVDSFRAREGIEVEKIKDFTNAVVSVNTAPKNNNRLLVTNGNYGTNNHVHYSSNALDSAQNVTFSVLDDKGPQSAHLPTMPVYDGIFRMDSSDQIIVGTEMGVWFYDMNQPNQGWSEINNGMARVPTHMLKQVKPNKWAKGPKVYAATHGRGIFMTSSFNPNTGFDDRKANKEDNSEPSLKLYPNPASTYTMVNFDIPDDARGNLQLIALSGKVVKDQVVIGKTKKQEIRLSTGNLKTGNYVVRISGSSFSKTAKLSVTR